MAWNESGFDLLCLLCKESVKVPLELFSGALVGQIDHCANPTVWPDYNCSRLGDIDAVSRVSCLFCVVEDPAKWFHA